MEAVDAHIKQKLIGPFPSCNYLMIGRVSKGIKICLRRPKVVGGVGWNTRVEHVGCHSAPYKAKPVAESNEY